MAQAGVHQRAMAAWRSISHQTQLLWNVLEFVSRAADGADLRLTFRCFVCGVDHPERYRVLMRMHLTSPGGCINHGKMRNFLALQNCPAPGGVIDFVIPDYKQSPPAGSAQVSNQLPAPAAGHSDRIQEPTHSGILPVRPPLNGRFSFMVLRLYC